MTNSPCISHFIVTALQQRCSVVTNTDNGETVIIDGGGDSQRIIQWIDSGIGEPDSQIGEYDGERKVVALINTHAHFDHSGDIPYFNKVSLLYFSTASLHFLGIALNGSSPFSAK